ncbi:type I-E CRISPR-associated protein Cse2/CasB [Desulfocurvus sp. DL9XJH121]
MQQQFYDAQNKDEFWGALRSWWHSLEHDRGQRATLRRAKIPGEVFLNSAFWRGPVAALERKGFTFSLQDLERLALPLGLLAHAKSLADRDSLPRMLAQSGKGGEAVRDVRFRKLLAVGDEDRDGLYMMLIRLTRMLDGDVPLQSLVKGTFRWNDDTRRQWARQYYTSTNPKQS